MFIKITLKEQEQKSFELGKTFDITLSTIDDNIFDLIKEEFKNNNILFINITSKENDMEVEFGYNCFL